MPKPGEMAQKRLESYAKSSNRQKCHAEAIFECSFEIVG